MDNGELIVSQRDLQRMHVIQLTLEGRASVWRGAELLGLSARQVKRLRKKMRERGAQGLLHGNRGSRPWNRTVGQVVKKVLQLAKGRYQGLNDTHLTEKLGEKEGMKLSRQTIRRLLPGRNSCGEEAPAQASLQEAGEKSAGGRASGVGRQSSSVAG